MCVEDITFILHQSVHAVYTPRCNKQKIRNGRNGKRERRRDNQRETDDDDKRNWIWVKDSKPLSLNTNIKGIVGKGNYETFKKRSLISQVISRPGARG